MNIWTSLGRNEWILNKRKNERMLRIESELLGFRVCWLARIILYNNSAKIALENPPLTSLIRRIYAIRWYVGMLGLPARIEWYSWYAKLYSDAGTVR